MSGIYAIGDVYNEPRESGESRRARKGASKSKWERAKGRERLTGFFNNGNEGVARIFTSLSRPLYSLNRLPHMPTLTDIIKLYLAARSIVRSNVNETGLNFNTADRCMLNVSNGRYYKPLL